MSIVAQNNTDEVALLDCIQKFFSRYHVGKILKNVTAPRKKVSLPSL